MGDMADWILDNAVMDEAGLDPMDTGTGSLHYNKVCKYCGAACLWWGRIEGKWRLLEHYHGDESGVSVLQSRVHKCREYGKNRR